MTDNAIPPTPKFQLVELTTDIVALETRFNELDRQGYELHSMVIQEGFNFVLFTAASQQKAGLPPELAQLMSQLMPNQDGLDYDDDAPDNISKIELP